MRPLVRRRVRPLLRLAGGAVLGPIIAFALGLWPQDALYGTVAVVPFALVASREIHRWAAAHGGRSVSPSSRRVTLGLTTLWLLAVPASEHLGLPHAEEILAAALFVLVALEVRRLLLALRPALGTELTARPPLVFFWLPLLVYIVVLPWSVGQRPPDGDEPYYLLVAHSLAFDGDTDLSDNYLRQDSRRFMDRALAPQPGDPVGPDGERYSRHNLLLPLLLAVPYRLGGRLGAVLLMTLLAAVAAYLLLRILRHLHVAPGPALLAYSVFSFAPPLLVYAHQIWVEVPAAVLMLVALDVTWSHRRGADGGSNPERGRQLLFWGALLCLPLLKLRFLLVAAPIAVLLWWRSGRRLLHLVAGAAGATLATVALLGYNWIAFDNPLRTYGFDQVLSAEMSPTVALRRLVGLLFDPAFGLLGVAPVWLLLAPAVLELALRRRRLAVELMLIASPTLIAIATRREWYGGWSPPFRYGVVLLPLLAISLAPLLAERRRGGARSLLVTLVLATLMLSVVWLTLPGWTYDLADGGSRIADAVGTRLQADVNRLLPSGVRPRAATWIVPLVAFLGAIALWWRPRHRLRHPARVAVVVLLVGTTAVAATARLASTGTIQFEDRHVRKDDGHIYPGRWTIDRTRYASGWTLPDGGRITAPVVPGGETVSGRLRLKLIDNGAPIRPLVLRTDGRTLLRWTPERTSEWQEAVLDPVSWSGGERLTLTTTAGGIGGADGPPNGLVLDRLDLEWR